MSYETICEKNYIWSVHNNFTGKQFLNFAILKQKLRFKLLRKGQFLNSRVGFELIIYRFVVKHPLTHCTTLLCDKFEKETIYKITFDYPVYFDK